MSTLNSILYKTDITIWQANGLTSTGFPSVSAPTTEKAFHVKKTKLVKKMSGEETLAQDEIYTQTELTEGDFVLIGTSAEAHPPNTAKRVIVAEKIPSLISSEEVKVAYL